MTDNDFICLELGIINFDDVDAYSPTDFQRQFLAMLEEGIENSSSKLAMNLFELAYDAGQVPKNKDGSSIEDSTIPFSREHIQMIVNIRESRKHGLEQKKTAQNSLQKKTRPAFELVQDLSDKYIDFYKDDLKRRWSIAVQKCRDEGVVSNDAGKMIAMTDSPVWKLLGSLELFDDGLEIDYPPFYVNGGWLFGWKSCLTK